MSNMNARHDQHTADKEKSNVVWYRADSTKIAGITILLIFMIGFLFWYFAFRPFISTDDARVSGNIVNVANVGTSGQIIKVDVKEGDAITNGEILIELDHSIAEARYEQAKANENFAQTSFERIASLSGSMGSVKQQYDMTLSKATIAKANLKLAKLALEHTYLKSPVTGVVIRKNAVVGDILEMNQVAVTIIDITNVWVSANISEKSINLIKPGQRVEITIDAGGRLNGVVSEIRNASSSVFSLIPSGNASGNFIKVTQRIPVKIKLDPHPGTKLRLGESVEIKIRAR